METWKKLYYTKVLSEINDRIKTLNTWKIKYSHYLIAIVSPWGPFHIAVLDIEGEKFDIDVTRAAKNAMTQPDYLTIVTDNHVCVDHGTIVLRISAKTEEQTPIN